jgi:hypothetical protein|tara:strand:- start:50 stop:511 length:462 start_codon:yes stop_codon:yes gene_type:complete
MKLLLENWRKYLTEAELYGNCGMVAIAMVEEAALRGIENVRIILVHDAPTYGTTVKSGEGEYDIAHVVAKIGNKYFDDRGEITEDQITIIDGEDLLDPHMSEEFIVETLPWNIPRDETEAIKRAIERNTNWDKCSADFEERASQLLDEAGYLP